MVKYWYFKLQLASTFCNPGLNVRFAPKQNGILLLFYEYLTINCCFMTTSSLYGRYNTSFHQLSVYNIFFQHELSYRLEEVNNTLLRSGIKTYDKVTNLTISSQTSLFQCNLTSKLRISSLLQDEKIRKHLWWHRSRALLLACVVLAEARFCTHCLHFYKLMRLERQISS